MMAPSRRQRALLGMLAVTLVLTAMSGEGWNATDEPLQAVQPARAPRPAEAVPADPPVPAPHIELERLQRRDVQAGAGNETRHAFQAMSWYVPPPPPPLPPPPKPVPPPPPTAPPVPFSFLGRYVEDDRLIILLVRGERIYTIGEGEVIDNTYRIDRLTDSQLELTYLPLDIKQTISAGRT